MAADGLERAMLAGAARALRKRADRQLAIVKAQTEVNEKGAVVRSAEGAVAAGLSAEFAGLAAEFERDAELRDGRA